MIIYIIYIIYLQDVDATVKILEWFPEYVSEN